MIDSQNNKFGFYRALVIDNKDPERKGRVKVWIPDTMPEINPKEGKGLWAMSANNPIGGRNDEFGETENHFAGSSFVPTKGSYVFVFFEAGNPNRPFYFGAADLRNTPTLPECQTGEYQKKWVLFKSHDGRCITMSDDSEDSRVEITGKKRTLSGPPSGSTSSVYEIDGNQTSILLDERNGKEKILIRSHKGDFISIDVEKQELKITFKNNIYIKSGKSIFLSAEENINIMTHGDLIFQTDGTTNISSSEKTQILSGESFRVDAPETYLNSGNSEPKKIPDTEFEGNR